MSSRILFGTKKLFCSYVYLGTKPLFVTWIITAVSHNRQTSISLSQTLHGRHFLYFASALLSLLYSSSIFSLYSLAYSSSAFSSYTKFLSWYWNIIIFTSFDVVFFVQNIFHVFGFCMYGLKTRLILLHLSVWHL